MSLNCSATPLGGETMPLDHAPIPLDGTIMPLDDALMPLDGTTMRLDRGITFHFLEHMRIANMLASNPNKMRNM